LGTASINVGLIYASLLMSKKMALGRERLTNVWCLNAMLQSGERLL